MGNNKDCANKGIECSVANCANHCDNENYCTLKKITVGATCKTPQKPENTDCCSFVERTH